MNECEFDCVMTLALPVALEEEVLDFLLGHPEWVGGFSVVDAQGMGRGAHLHSTMEKVKGRARRRLVSLLLRQVDVEPLVAGLKLEFGGTEMVYWAAPLIAFGRLG